MSVIASGVGDWTESCAAERRALMQRQREVSRARKGIVRLLGGDAVEPKGLAALEEISLAHCECAGDGTTLAVPGAAFKITTKDTAGVRVARRLPDGHTFEVTVVAQRADDAAAAVLARGAVVDNGDGTHDVKYSLGAVVKYSLNSTHKKAETVEVHVTLHGSHVSGSPFRATTIDHAAEFAAALSSIGLAQYTTAFADAGYSSIGAIVALAEDQREELALKIGKYIGRSHRFFIGLNLRRLFRRLDSRNTRLLSRTPVTAASEQSLI